MTEIKRSALVRCSANQMYQLVNDVEAYPEFLPWCNSAQVLSHDAVQMRANIGVARAGLRRSFITVNRLHPGKMIEMRLVAGPFRHLEGNWRFLPLREDACRVSLDLRFEMAGLLAQKTLGPIFAQVSLALVDAFCRRATQAYGMH